MSIKGLFPMDKWDFKSESIFADLRPEDLELLTAHKSEHVYKKNDILFREGTYPSGIFFINKGKVKKYKVDRDGKEQIIYLANTAELIGYHAVLSEDRYPDSAAVMEESVITFIPKDMLEINSHDHSAANPDLSYMMCFEAEFLLLFGNQNIAVEKIKNAMEL